MEDVSGILGKGDWTSCSEVGCTFRTSEFCGIHNYVTFQVGGVQDSSTDHDCLKVSDGQAWLSKTIRATLFFSQFLNFPEFDSLRIWFGLFWCVEALLLDPI